MEFLTVRVIGWEVVVIARRFDAVFEQDKRFRHDPIELRDVNEYVSVSWGKFSHYWSIWINAGLHGYYAVFRKSNT